MDDYLGGTDTGEQTNRMRQKVTLTLEKAWLHHIRKQTSKNKVVMNNIFDKLHENEERSLAENDHSVKTLGLNWHSVSDCFQYRCTNKLDSVKPLGILQCTANLIKPSKASSIDFEAITVIAKKLKKGGQVQAPR